MLVVVLSFFVMVVCSSIGLLRSLWREVIFVRSVFFLFFSLIWENLVS